MALVSHQSFSTLGGISVHIRQLADALSVVGVDVKVIAPASSSQNSKQMSSYDFTATSICLGSRLATVRNLEFSYKVYRYLAENKKKFDAVHGSQYSMFFPCIKKRRIGLPAVTKFHGTVFHENLKTIRCEGRYWALDSSGELAALPVYACTESICGRKSDGVICISQSVKSEVLSMAGHRSEGKTQVIYNGVDLAKFRPFGDVDGLRATLGIGRDDKVVLYVGLLQARKGVHYLIASAKKLLKKYPQLKVLIAGAGGPNYTSYIHELAQQESNFLFLGKVSSDKLPALYNLADVCVVPSIYEPLGNVALEAMACGKPVLAGDAGGLRELISHGNNGFLLNTDCLENELVKYLDLSLADSELRQTLGRNARAYAEQNFSWKKTAMQTVDFIEKISAVN